MYHDFTTYHMGTLQVLQVPADKYTIKDSDKTEIATENQSFVIARSISNGPRNRFNLACLPVKESLTIRPANCITRPNHVLWTLRTGAEVKQFFLENFPRLNFENLISDKEWDRFARADGLAFPPCQYTPGLQASPGNGQCGIVLLGDAAHSFSPDIGQGINAGFMDVVKLDEILKTTASKTPCANLGTALKEYERLQAPETKALIRIARFGAPYQYNQSPLKDRLGKKLYTMNVIIRVLLNKITFGLVPKPMVLMLQNPNLSYLQVARRADVGTAGFISAFGFLLVKLIMKRYMV